MTSNKAVAALLITCLASAPAFADHVPSRKAAPKAGADRVAERMVELGVTSAVAQDEVARMTSGDVEYFSRDLERVQVVGAAQDLFAGQSDNLWYETLGGMGFLGVGVLIMLFMSSH